MRHSGKRQLLDTEEAHRGNLRESQRNSIYSERNACTGSTSAARRAGKRQAISAVAVSKTVGPPRSTGLWVETWWSGAASNRPGAKVAPIPTTGPATTG